MNPMDAPTPSSVPTYANTTPLRIGAVALRARNLDHLTNFYHDALGLTVMDRDAKHTRLGAGGVPLLELIAAPDAKPDDPRTAGLFHTAFLQPTRGDLARWLVHIARNRVPLTGASDHAVSEAIYLDDPEGNGIEVYRDRLPEQWRWNGERIHMTTDRLDLDNLAEEAGATPYTGAPAGLRIGHIHLRVGDVGKAQEFYSGGVGLDVTSSRHGAAFLSSGKYHHHVGSNVWQSAGAAARDEGRAGLAWFTFEAADAATLAAAKQRLEGAKVPIGAISGGFEVRDPWGTQVRFAA